MNYQEPDEKRRDHYDSISTETRRLLIKLTQQDMISIRKACKALQIKYSTGKTLVQQFKKTGKIDRIKQQRTNSHEARNNIRKIITRAFAQTSNDNNNVAQQLIENNISSQNDSGPFTSSDLQVSNPTRDGVQIDQTSNAQLSEALKNQNRFSFKAHPYDNLGQAIKDQLPSQQMTQQQRWVKKENRPFDQISFSYLGTVNSKNITKMQPDSPQNRPQQRAFNRDLMQGIEDVVPGPIGHSYSEKDQDRLKSKLAFKINQLGQNSHQEPSENPLYGKQIHQGQLQYQDKDQVFRIDENENKSYQKMGGPNPNKLQIIAIRNLIYEKIMENKLKNSVDFSKRSIGQDKQDKQTFEGNDQIDYAGTQKKQECDSDQRDQIHQNKSQSTFNQIQKAQDLSERQATSQRQDQVSKTESNFNLNTQKKIQSNNMLFALLNQLKSERNVARDKNFDWENPNLRSQALSCLLKQFDEVNFLQQFSPEDYNNFERKVMEPKRGRYIAGRILPGIRSKQIKKYIKIQSIKQSLMLKKTIQRKRVNFLRKIHNNHSKEKQQQINQFNFTEDSIDSANSTQRSMFSFKNYREKIQFDFVSKINRKSIRRDTESDKSHFQSKSPCNSDNKININEDSHAFKAPCGDYSIKTQSRPRARVHKYDKNLLYQAFTLQKHLSFKDFSHLTNLVAEFIKNYNLTSTPKAEIQQLLVKLTAKDPSDQKFLDLIKQTVMQVDDEPNKSVSPNVENENISSEDIQRIFQAHNDGGNLEFELQEILNASSHTSSQSGSNNKNIESQFFTILNRDSGSQDVDMNNLNEFFNTLDYEQLQALLKKLEQIKSTENGTQSDNTRELVKWLQGISSQMNSNKDSGKTERDYMQLMQIQYIKLLYQHLKKALITLKRKIDNQKSSSDSQELSEKQCDEVSQFLNFLQLTKSSEYLTDSQDQTSMHYQQLQSIADNLQHIKFLMLKDQWSVLNELSKKVSKIIAMDIQTQIQKIGNSESFGNSTNNTFSINGLYKPPKDRYQTSADADNFTQNKKRTQLDQTNFREVSHQYHSEENPNPYMQMLDNKSSTLKVGSYNTNKLGNSTQNKGWERKRTVYDSNSPEPMSTKNLECQEGQRENFSIALDDPNLIKTLNQDCYPNHQARLKDGGDRFIKSNVNSMKLGVDRGLIYAQKSENHLSANLQIENKHKNQLGVQRNPDGVSFSHLATQTVGNNSQPVQNDQSQQQSLLQQLNTSVPQRKFTIYHLQKTRLTKSLNSSGSSSMRK